MKVIIKALIALPLLISSQTVHDFCLIESTSGVVELREPFGEAWQSVTNGTKLIEGQTIRTDKNGKVRIRTFDQSIMELPSLAQIEVRDMKRMTRDDLILELTALELQQLPNPENRDNSERAFVLHGAPYESATKVPESVIQQEDNGAMALYEQGFIPGFILKWNRWRMAFPELTLPNADQAISKAYEQMDMPARMKATEQ
jgi:hypothetical protein